jgi:hypothetical protein
MVFWVIGNLFYMMSKISLDTGSRDLLEGIK